MFRAVAAGPVGPVSTTPLIGVGENNNAPIIDHATVLGAEGANILHDIAST